MQLDDQQSELLFRLVQSQGTGVIHLPYTPEFENLCALILNRPPSTDEKHDIWERVVQLQGRAPEPDAPMIPPDPQAPGSPPAVIIPPPSFSPVIHFVSSRDS